MIIPAYNEVDSIERVIENVRTHFAQSDILGVNEGSIDLTSKKARAEGVFLDLPLISRDARAALLSVLAGCRLPLSSTRRPSP